MYYNKKYCCYFYKCLTPKIKKNLLIMYDTYNNEDKLLLNFEEVFINLNKYDKKLLDDLFNYAKNYNKNYINKLVFISYIINSNCKIPLMEESYIVCGNNNENELLLDHNGKYMNIKLFKNIDKQAEIKRKKLVNMKSNTIDKTLINEFPDINSNELCIFSKNTLYYDNSTQFLIAFLNWMFSSENNYYIKKCEKCNNYYVSTKSDNKYCNLIKTFDDGKEYTCANFVKKFKDKPKYKDFRAKDKAFLKKIDYNYNFKNLSNDYLIKYTNLRDDKIDEAIKNNNINILVNFVDNYEKEHPFN